MVPKDLAGTALGGGGVAGAATRAHPVGNIVTQGRSGVYVDVCGTVQIHRLPVSSIGLGEHDGGAQGSDKEECDRHGMDSYEVR